MAGSPYGFALVAANDGTLLGRLRKAVLDADPAARTEQVMEAGPSTVRADRPLAELAERLRSRGLRTAVVTTPEGRLLGLVRRADMEARLAASAEGSTIGRVRANRIHGRGGDRRFALLRFRENLTFSRCRLGRRCRRGLRAG